MYTPLRLYQLYLISIYTQRENSNLFLCNLFEQAYLFRIYQICAGTFCTLLLIAFAYAYVHTQTYSHTHTRIRNTYTYSHTFAGKERSQSFTSYACLNYKNALGMLCLALALPHTSALSLSLSLLSLSFPLSLTVSPSLLISRAAPIGFTSLFKTH